MSESRSEIGRSGKGVGGREGGRVKGNSVGKESALM